MALVVAASAGACGLPTGGQASVVPKEDVPYGLLETPTAPPTVSPSPGVTLVGGTVYLVDGEDRLVPTTVVVAPAQVAPLVQSLLNRLAVGPTERDRAQNLTTDLAPGSTMVLREISDGRATIEIQSAGQEANPQKLPVGIGQIVNTVTSVVGVDSVQFVRDGSPVSVPGPPDSGNTSRPLAAKDYEDLLAPATTTPPRTQPLPATPTTTGTAASTATP